MRHNLSAQLRRQQETGFTLIETMMTVAVLVVVLGIVFSYIGRFAASLQKLKRRRWMPRRKRARFWTPYSANCTRQAFRPQHVWA